MSWVSRVLKKGTLQVTAKLRRGTNAYYWYCPGCEEMHPLPDRWTFDGNLESPTFNPSFKHDWHGGCCHYVVTTGQVAYCGDCTHGMANQTIPMPDLPKELCDMNFLSHLWPHHHRRYHPSHHHVRVLFIVLINDQPYHVAILEPHMEVHMSTIVNIGHTISLAVIFLDANGNPMLTAPTPDSPPAWTDTTPATETLAVAPSGLMAVATPVAPGTDTVSLTVVVGGKSFAATLAVEVDPAPQVLTSVQISATVS